ncbi:MAG: hypothetical protein Q8N90_04040, partial [bacterium]|nr:hypothetical protein [bacterium]
VLVKKSYQYSPDYSLFKIGNYSLSPDFPIFSSCKKTSLIMSLWFINPEDFIILAEVEKEATQSVFFYLKEGKYSVFIEPTKDLID